MSYTLDLKQQKKKSGFINNAEVMTLLACCVESAACVERMLDVCKHCFYF